MAKQKQPYNWGRVRPGDIISFRYKPKSGEPSKLQTLLVLNPRMPVIRKDRTQTKHLIGIKLEEKNQIELKMTDKRIGVLEQVGAFETIDVEHGIYRIKFKDRFVINDIKGVKKNVYEIISRSNVIRGQYRSYDYRIASKSAVYLEPIILYGEIDDASEQNLEKQFENADEKIKKELKKEAKKPKHPKKPKQPEPPKTPEIKKSDRLLDKIVSKLKK